LKAARHRPQPPQHVRFQQRALKPHCDQHGYSIIPPVYIVARAVARAATPHRRRSNMRVNALRTAASSSGHARVDTQRPDQPFPPRILPPSALITVWLSGAEIARICCISPCITRLSWPPWEGYGNAGRRTVHAPDGDLSKLSNLMSRTTRAWNNRPRARDPCERRNARKGGEYV